MNCMRTIRAMLIFVLGCLLASPTYAMVSQPSADPWGLMRIVVDEADRANIDPALALAVARVESNFRADVVSDAGAIGLMQIMPRTASMEFGVNPQRLSNARLNARIGAHFLKQLINRYGGRVDIALSHYNGGSRVRNTSGDLAVIPKTRPYVRKVLSWRNKYRHHPLVMALNDQPERLEVRHLAPKIYLDDFSDPGSVLFHRLKVGQSVVDRGEKENNDNSEFGLEIGFVEDDSAGDKRIQELRHIRWQNLDRSNRMRNIIAESRL